MKRVDKERKEVKTVKIGQANVYTVKESREEDEL
jgi:hypothetical protein